MQMHFTRFSAPEVDSIECFVFTWIFFHISDFQEGITKKRKRIPLSAFRPVSMGPIRCCDTWPLCCVCAIAHFVKNILYILDFTCGKNAVLITVVVVLSYNIQHTTT